MTKQISRDSGIKVIKFPDGQPHINITGVSAGDDITVLWPIRNPDEAVELLMICEAIDGLLAYPKHLMIPYLMGARYDRRMQHGDSVDLKVVASMINSCCFDTVEILDVHSDVALQLIDRSVNISNRRLVETYKDPDSVLIIPDTGAQKKADKYLAWNPNISNIVTCIKTRTVQTGKIDLTVIKPENCKDLNCVIIDDLCDGGATFIAIAKQIKPKKLTLIVTHGIFSKGFKELAACFDSIITTDSFKIHTDPYLNSKFFTSIPAKELF